MTNLPLPSSPPLSSLEGLENLKTKLQKVRDGTFTLNKEERRWKYFFLGVEEQGGVDAIFGGGYIPSACHG